MTALNAIAEGFRTARRVGAAVWAMFFVNLGLAALAGWPNYRGIFAFTGHSLMSQQLLSGLSEEWLTDFAFNNPGALDRYAMLIALFGLVSIPANSVLAGGVLARLGRLPEELWSLVGFFRDCARFAGRLLRLMVIGLFLYWVVFRVFHQGADSLIDWATRDLFDERPEFWARLGAAAILLGGLVFVNLAMDFARLKLVVEDSPSAAGALIASFGFVLGRLRRALTVYAVPSLAGLALLGIYWLAVPWSLIHASATEGAVGGEYREPLVVALLFLGQQLVIFGRYWFRAAAWAAEWALYSESK